MTLVNLIITVNYCITDVIVKRSNEHEIKGVIKLPKLEKQNKIEYSKFNYLS